MTDTKRDLLEIPQGATWRGKKWLLADSDTGEGIDFIAENALGDDWIMRMEIRDRTGVLVTRCRYPADVGWDGTFEFDDAGNYWPVLEADITAELSASDLHNPHVFDVELVDPLADTPEEGTHRTVQGQAHITAEVTTDE